MTVDYRLLAKWEASQHRHEQARRALPARWQNANRFQVHAANEGQIRAHLHEQESDARRLETAASPVRLPLDDR
jgi:hypothetical protein